MIEQQRTTCLAICHSQLDAPQQECIVQLDYGPLSQSPMH